MDHLEYSGPLLIFFNKNPNQYMSVTNIFKHATKHNICNTNHTPQILQVQVVA